MKEQMKKLILGSYLGIFGRKSFYIFNKFLYTLGLKGMGITNYQSDFISGEKVALDLIKRNMSSSRPIFMDVGANRGEYSAMLIRLFPFAKIYSFEPVDSSFCELKRNLSPFNNIEVIKKGLSSKEGRFDIYHGKNEKASPHSSMYLEVEKRHNKKEIMSEKIEVTTIDLFCKNRKLKKINFLKIDVEGHEYDVLLGAKEMIKNKRIEVIQFEFNEMAAVSKHFLYEFHDLLKEYFFYRILTRGVVKIDIRDSLTSEIFSFQNILAIKKEL